jgi:hypothetical protein
LSSVRLSPHHYQTHKLFRLDADVSIADILQVQAGFNFFVAIVLTVKLYCGKTTFYSVSKQEITELFSQLAVTQRMLKPLARTLWSFGAVLQPSKYRL